MTNEISISTDDIDSAYQRLNGEAVAGGYHLNSDVDFTKDLAKGLLVNEKRYGYQSCPCRLASGNEDEDLDIVCPCDYRDQDVVDYDSCYCGLYVSQAVMDGNNKIGAVPERRLSVTERHESVVKAGKGSIYSLPVPIWRCRVCGYLCGRDRPPEVCPICKAKAERFEKFIE